MPLFASASPATFADGVDQTRVHIFGEIREPTCNIVNSDIDVDFGTIINKELYLRKKTRSIPFSIDLDKCDIKLNRDAVVKFVGNESTAPDLQGFLDIDSSSTASGIAVGIENVNGKFIPLREDSTKWPINAEFVSLKFKAFVEASNQAIQNGTIGLGPFRATATFYIAYE